MDRIPFNAARYPDEDFQTYQIRRWNENGVFEYLMRPRLVWDAVKNGPYTKEKAEDIAKNTFTMRLEE